MSSGYTASTLTCSLIFSALMLFDVSSVQTLPFFGVVPAILNESGEELEGECEGYLVSWDRHGPAWALICMTW